MNMIVMATALAQTPAPSGAPSGASMVFSFFPFVLIFVVFYFLLILPQQKKAKKRKEMLAALKKGDKVVTTGGMFGTVTTLSKSTVTLQIADGVRVKVTRTGVEDLRGEEE